MPHPDQGSVDSSGAGGAALLDVSIRTRLSCHQLVAPDGVALAHRKPIQEYGPIARPVGHENPRCTARQPAQSRNALVMAPKWPVKTPPHLTGNTAVSSRCAPCRLGRRARRHNLQNRPCTVPSRRTARDSSADVPATGGQTPSAARRNAGSSTLRTGSATPAAGRPVGAAGHEEKESAPRSLRM